MNPKNPTMEDLTKVYLKIREARKAKTAEYEKEDARLKEQLATLEAAMMAKLDADKVTSTKTEFGTVYKQVDIKPSASDWAAFYRWIAEDPDRFEFLQKRITIEPVKTYMEDHKDEDDNPMLPPGVSVMRTYVVRVRQN